MSCGIPIYNHYVHNSHLPQSVDFCDPNQFVWDTPDILYDNLKNVSIQFLLDKSESARIYFLKNNESNVVKEKIIYEIGNSFKLKNDPEFVISDLLDTKFFPFGDIMFNEELYLPENGVSKTIIDTITSDLMSTIGNFDSMEQRYQIVRWFKAEVADRDQAVINLKAEVVERDQAKKKLMAQKNELEEYIFEIHGSRAWRFVQFLRHLKSSFWPQRKKN
jgi:hypothetical protein